MFACCWGNGQLCTLIAALLFYYVMPSHEYVVFTCMLPLWDGDGRRSSRYQTVRYVCMHPWAIMPVFLLTTKCLLLHLLPKCRYVIFFADWCDPHEKWKQSRIFVWEGQMVDLPVNRSEELLLKTGDTKAPIKPYQVEGTLNTRSRSTIGCHIVSPRHRIHGPARCTVYVMYACTYWIAITLDALYMDVSLTMLARGVFELLCSSLIL